MSSAAKALPQPLTAPAHQVDRAGRLNAARARRKAAALRQRAELADRVPTHVQHCYSGGARDWWLYIWNKNQPGTVSRVPYHCGSWRCPECRKQDARVNYARFVEACAPLKEKGWLFLTLTLKRDGVKGWKDVDAAYKDLSVKTRNFFSRLRRWQKRCGWKPLGKEWVGVVECHRSGWPHMHFMLWSPELATHVRANPQPEHLLPEELAIHAQACGWGVRCQLEPAKETTALASYLVKLAGEADGLVGEIAKLTQLPTVAPIKFRRLRAGKNFLPPRKSNPEYTGTLLRQRQVASGVSVAPVHAVADCALVAHLCEHEEELSHNSYWLGTPQKPDTKVQVPAHVVQSYNEQRELDRVGGRGGYIPSSPGKLSQFEEWAEALGFPPPKKAVQ